MQKMYLVISMLFVFSLGLIGCGGGGGGSEAAAPAPTSGTIEVKSEARPATSSVYSEAQIDTTAGSVLQVRYTITNRTGAPNSDATVTVELPEGATIEPGTVQLIYGSDSSTKVLPDTIGALGVTIPNGSWVYLKYQVRVATTATSGAKSIKTTVSGAKTPGETKINVTGGGNNNNPTCPQITNPTCQSGYELQAGANDSAGCPTTGTCVQDSCAAVTQPTCQSGYHFVSGGYNNSGCLLVGSCVQDTNSCPTVNQPTCPSGQHRQANPSVGGCPQPDSCVLDAHTCQPAANPTCNAGYHLVSGGTDSYGCAVAGTCVQDATQTQTGVVTVRTNVTPNGIANVQVTCAGINRSNFMSDLGNGYWGFTYTMSTGSCSLSNYPTSIEGTTYTLNTGTSTLTGNLTTSGLTLTLMFDGAPAPNPGGGGDDGGDCPGCGGPSGF